MNFPNPQSFQIIISCLCLLIIAMNSLIMIVLPEFSMKISTHEWTFCMVNITTGIAGLVTIYHKRRNFLVSYFFIILMYITILVSYSSYDFYINSHEVNETMIPELARIEGTDAMYEVQRKLQCCEDYNVAEIHLNSMTGSCCGKANNDVCLSIDDVFKKSCLSPMIDDAKKKIIIRFSLAIIDASLLLITSILSILLYLSYYKRLKRILAQRMNLESHIKFSV